MGCARPSGIICDKTTKKLATQELVFRAFARHSKLRSTGILQMRPSENLHPARGTKMLEMWFPGKTDIIEK
jgi:hypothetical protein